MIKAQVVGKYLVYDIYSISKIVKCVCLSKLSSRILSMVDPSIIHGWKGLFVLMCSIKNPIDFGPRNGYFCPKTIFLLTKV